MIQRLYTIRDLVAEENGPIFTAKNDGVALRQFKEILTSIQNDPEEYKRYGWSAGSFLSDGDSQAVWSALHGLYLPRKHAYRKMLYLRWSFGSFSISLVQAVVS